MRSDFSFALIRVKFFLVIHMHDIVNAMFQTINENN